MNEPQEAGDARREYRPCRGWQLLVVCIAMLRPGIGAATGADVDDIASGSLVLQTPQGVEVATALETSVRMRINGLVARVSVRQSFENAGGDWAEGIYVFPLPDKAAVDHMRLLVGERVIEGEIREKEQARREYEQARREGRRTSLVEQQRPNLFTTKVANIAPGETVVVEIEYLEDLVFADGMFSLRFPLTLTPRYIPGQPLPDRQGSGWSADTTRVPDASLVTPPMVATSKAPTVTFDIDLDAGLPLDVIASRYHPITVKDEAGRYRVALSSRAAPMDHDFELVWRPEASHAPQAMIFAQTRDDEPYYLLMVMPPTAPAPDVPPMPREMVLVVDTSGSMHGVSITQARLALLRALDGLLPVDRFNVIAFNSTTTSLFPISVDASAENLARARRFVQTLGAEGGTEMRPALELALRVPPAESHLRQVVFVTDGAVGNEKELFALIERQLGPARLFTVGIGSAPNSWFMRKAAEAGRGSFTMISAQNEVGERMDRLLAKIARPQVTDIRVEWPRGAVVESYPEVVPDLYAGEPVSLRAKLAAGPAGTDTVRISGNSVTGAWQRELSIAAGLPTAPANGVAALWARGRIGHLADERRRGRNADDVRAEIVSTALAHHLVSEFTSLVAVDRTPARSAAERLRRDAVPNALPYGQSMNAIFGLPATATNAAQLAKSGTLVVLLGLAVWLAGRRGSLGRVALQ